MELVGNTNGIRSVLMALRWQGMTGVIQININKYHCSRHWYLSLRCIRCTHVVKVYLSNFALVVGESHLECRGEKIGVKLLPKCFLAPLSQWVLNSVCDLFGKSNNLNGFYEYSTKSLRFCDFNQNLLRIAEETLNCPWATPHDSIVLRFRNRFSTDYDWSWEEVLTLEDSLDKMEKFE